MWDKLPAHANIYLTFTPVGSGWRHYLVLRTAKKADVASTLALRLRVRNEECALLLYVPTLRAIWVPVREIKRVEIDDLRGVSTRMRKIRAERNASGLRYSGSVVKEALELLRVGRPTAAEIADDEREAIDVDLPDDTEVEANVNPETETEITMDANSNVNGAATTATAATATPAKAKKTAPKKAPAKATGKKAAAAPKAKAAGGKKTGFTRVDGTQKITVLAKENPYRKDTALNKRFGYLSTGMTVDDVIAKVVKAGGSRGNATGFLGNAVANKHIKLG